MHTHPPSPHPLGIECQDYGRLSNGRLVRAFTLHNGLGLSLTAINLGGIVTALQVPDRHGHTANVMLGCASLSDYEFRNPHFGTLVGRYANRIAHGRFELDGATFQLSQNAAPHCLHGGAGGLGSVWWHIEALPVAEDGTVGLALRHCSPDGDQGFPGELDITVRYTLTPQQEWRIDYSAQCSRSTVINLTHHAYFNLAGHGTVLDHLLTLPARQYCAVDPSMIPHGMETVEGSPFDFRKPTRIGARIRDAHPQLLRAKGYDHCWVLDTLDKPALQLAARLVDPATGRVMEVSSTEPGVQFYSGNFLDASLAGPAGKSYRQSDGLCLETQHFPDSPNRPDFPSTTLRPGRVFSSTTVHRFSVLSTP